jgi:nucleoside-diphosphate-sugar epimerase
MNVTVVGGSGFVGSALCRRLLNKKIDFSILDIKQSKYFPEAFKNTDIRSESQLNRSIETKSVLINLAAEHRDDVSPKSLYDQVNVDGAKNICRIADVKNIKKIIFTSSVAVYGFAKLGTDESGNINPFNDYGRTKFEAEQVYRKWQEKDPENRTLVIIRPTVIFGERNRGNVYNLLRQIASGKFLMVGNGKNRKSLAYVENVAAFLEYSLTFKPGLHIYNYIDKPDFTMNLFVSHVNKTLGRSEKINVRIPYFLGLILGVFFDLLARAAGKKLSISSIRVKKFCTNSVYESAISETGFQAPVALLDAINQTVKFEFLEDHKLEPVFFSD